MTFDCDEDGVIVDRAPFLRTRYNYDRDAASLASGLFCEEPTLAQQQFKDECDINTIVERFGLTGQLPNNLRVPITSEFVETMDYRESLEKLMEADDAFMQLPAKIRSEFDNDPGRFVDFISDEKNVEKAREWGLAMPAKKEAEPLRVKVVPDGAGNV